MLVRYWMATSLKTVAEDMNLEDALNLMHQYKIRRLPVVKDGHKLCGIIALSDLYPYLGPHDVSRADISEEEITRLREIRVADVMTKSLITCNKRDTIWDYHRIRYIRSVGQHNQNGDRWETDLFPNPS